MSFTNILKAAAARIGAIAAKSISEAVDEVHADPHRPNDHADVICAAAIEDHERRISALEPKEKAEKAAKSAAPKKAAKRSAK